MNFVKLRKSAVTLLTSLAVISSGAGMAVAQSTEAHFRGDPITYSAEINDARLVSDNGNTITVATNNGTITVTEDRVANTITVTDVDGSVEVLNRALLLSESGLLAPSPSPTLGGFSTLARVERGWKKYLCNAATSAVVGGHGKAWSIALKMISVHPAARAAVAGANFSAMVFLSTQC